MWLDNNQSRCYSCFHTIKRSQRGWMGSLPDIELIYLHVPRAFPRFLERGKGIRSGYSDLLQQELWKTIWGQESLVFCPINSIYHFFSYHCEKGHLYYTLTIFFYCHYSVITGFLPCKINIYIYIYLYKIFVFQLLMTPFNKSILFYIWVCLYRKVLSTMTCGFLFLSNDATKSDLKKLPALPTQALKEHPSLAYWWEICSLVQK